MTEADSRGRAAGNVLQNLSLLVSGGVMAAGLAVGVGLWQGGDRFLTQLREFFTVQQPAPQVDVQSIVVQQVRAVSELTTAVFAMQAVVPASRDRTFGGYTIGQTTLLYIAYGEVRAGVDLSQISPADVQIAGQAVSLRLPPPRILDSKIDVNRSKVYDYDRGFLGLGPDVAPELQEIAQRQTLQEIIATACDQGILQTASDRAQVAITQLLSTAGYQVTVVPQPPTADACSATAAPPVTAAPVGNPISLPAEAVSPPAPPALPPAVRNAPENVAPANPAPGNFAPANPAPAYAPSGSFAPPNALPAPNSTPVNPAPWNAAPVNPTSQNVAPGNPAPMGSGLPNPNP
ncbi:MAG: hypothetical protein Fur0046_18060 [Cyanobacteria bacterium J069]